MWEDDPSDLEDLVLDLDPALFERAEGFRFTDGVFTLRAYAPNLNLASLEAMEEYYFEVETPGRFRRYFVPLPADVDLQTKKALIYERLRTSVIGYFRHLLDDDFLEDGMTERDVAELLGDLFSALDRKYSERQDA